MEKFIRIDLFGFSAYIENEIGQQLYYTIEISDEYYSCFVQRRESKDVRWNKKRLVQASKNYFRLELADNESGIRILIPQNNCP